MSELYLVTGGAGFIGSHIVEELVRQGKRVRVLDFSTGKRENLASFEQLTGSGAKDDLVHLGKRGI